MKRNEIPRITGVYRIINDITGEFYIGSSVDIRMRFGTHMGRDAKNYQHKHKFYKDIIDYGESNFSLDILKECNRDELIKWEQYYFDLLKPTYNKVRPTENNFKNPEVIKMASIKNNTPEIIAKRKKLYNQPEYKEFFRHVHIDQMRPVEMIKDNIKLKEFISLQEASRYITETTTYKGKNKTSKIKAVCDGERKSAYGYKWRYK